LMSLVDGSGDGRKEEYLKIKVKEKKTGVIKNGRRC